MGVVQIRVIGIYHCCFNMSLTRHDVAESAVSVVWLINIFRIAFLLFFFHNTSVSLCVSLIFIINFDVMFLFLLNLNYLVWKVLNWRSLNNILFINVNINIEQSLSSLPVSRKTSSRLINENTGSFLVRGK